MTRELLTTSALGATCMMPPAVSPATLRYIKYTGAVRKYVTVEIADDGEELYYEQECGEPRWYPFQPSLVERGAVESLRAAGKGQNGWSAYIDVDTQGIDAVLPLAIDVNLFRSFIRSRYGRLSAVDIDRKLLAFVSDARAGS
jgi:hypothetical protein